MCRFSYHYPKLSVSPFFFFFCLFVYFFFFAFEVGFYFSERGLARLEIPTGNHPTAFIANSYTVESRSTATRLIRTPGYYGQFRSSRRKAHKFSLKLTRLIRTPVNTDDGHFSVSRVMNTHILSIFNLSKGLSTVLRSTYLSCKLKASAQQKVTDFFK